MKNYQVITIDREYASGGREIAHRLGEICGLPVYGKELTEYVAGQLGVPVRGDQEKPTNSLLYSLSVFGQLYRGEMVTAPNEDKIKQGEQELISKIGDFQKCIILGRCAGWTLRDRDDVLSIFVTANKEFRINRAVTEYGVEEAQVKNVVAKFDKKRGGFYHELTGGNWSEKKGYDIVMDSSRLGIDECVKVIAMLFDEK